MGTSRIATLRSLITKAKQAYYFGDRAIMTDREYDALEDELRKLAPDDPLLALVGAPVPADSILTKAEHSLPMGSQSKVNFETEFESWFNKTVVGAGAIHASLKGDGASAAAYYKDGKLQQVISRGDGFVGEDITANAVKFKGLPIHVETEGGASLTGAVRFEVILTVADWAKVDPSMAKNPRNLGNGIMGRKNGTESEMLSVFAFDIVDEAVTFASEQEKTARLQELGFQGMPFEICPTLADCVAYYEEIIRTRADLPFWIDGVVFKVDDLERQVGLGVTANRPKGQIAWKFEPEGAESIVRGVKISGGHTGSIVPTAFFDPVELGGTTVSNAALNNWEEIERLGLAIGDTVWVIKANDIIPKILEVRERADDREEIPEPTRCPFCGAETGRGTNTDGSSGAMTMCFNDDCEKKSSGRLKRWIKSLDIQGIGTSVRQALIDDLGVNDAADLYTLNEDARALSDLIINADKDIRLGDKRAARIIAEVDESRTLSLVQFIGSLGVDRLGKRRVQLMVDAAAGDLSEVSQWREGKLRDPDFAARAGVPNMGEVMQDSLDAMDDVIDRLLEQIEVGSIAASAAAPAPQKTVCITGSLPSGKKKDYAAPLAAVGFELVDKVTKALDILVLADPSSTSSKAEKARKYGCELLSEDALVALMASTEAAPAPAPAPAARAPAARAPAATPAAPAPVGSQKTVCITGRLPSGKKKKDYAAPLAAVGFRLVDKVTSGLDLLVLADPNSTSSKADKARKVGVELICEEELQDIIDAIAGTTPAPAPAPAPAKAKKPAPAVAGGKTVCIGKLPSGKKKKDYAAPLASAGFDLVDGVTKSLAYLVLADPGSNSSKAKKARQYGVDIIDEDQLNELIG